MPYYFALPLLTEMTIVQQSVLDQPGPVAISGGPGTGKSIVSLWRHIRNYATGSNTSLLLTYTKTLTNYLAAAAKGENEEAGKNVERTNYWLIKYANSRQEIIIDEAQDTKQNKLITLKGLAKTISYGADDQQILYPNEATTQAELRTLFPDNHPYELDENFRNSYEILHFTQAALPNKLISHNILSALRKERSTGILPKSIVTGSNKIKQQKAILDIIVEFQSETHNIGILLPRKNDVDAIFEYLINAKIVCTKYFYTGSEIDEIENVHVTTFKSSKGIEFDTVILPDFHLWRWNISNLYVVDENDYYVAFTRAKRNLYLICDTEITSISKSVFQTINA
jgi:superfamily I DNA/RNA helicase